MRLWHTTGYGVKQIIHYRTNIEKEGRETSAFILKDGEVLVMPEYKNDDSTSQIELYGYNVKGNVLTKHNEIFEIVGQIHTHQNRGLPSSPSYYLDSGWRSTVINKHAWSTGFYNRTQWNDIWYTWKMEQY